MKNNNALYKWLIVTFIILYTATAFVSFYHSITFFNIANAVWLSIILSLVAEIGQASVLFSLLLTKNKNNWLAWSVMFLLTALQIVGNVVSSFKYISVTNSIDFTYFQKSILFWVTNTNTDMFKIIIAWITGGILPIIALSMTALVADNLKLKEEEPQTIKETSDSNEEKNDDVPNQKNALKHVIEDLVEEIKQEREADKSDTADLPKEVSKAKTSRAQKQKKKSDVKGKNINLKPVKNLDSIKKLSRGTELIQTIQSDAHKNDKVLHQSEELIDQSVSDTPSESNKAPSEIIEEKNPDNLISVTYKDGKIIDKDYR